MAFAEDLTVFFNPAEFAEEVALNGVTVRGIFDDAYLFEDIQSSASAPAVTLASADVPANPAGLPVVARGVTYKVVEPMPNGTGVTVLRLRT